VFGRYGSMLAPANAHNQLPSCGYVHASLVQTGIASWYGPRFHGRQTATGEIYDMYKLTAAHRTLPLNTEVRVTNSKNGESIILRINDRGPYVRGRMIDLSLAAARALGMRDRGIAPVKVQVLCRPAPEMILLSPPRKPTNI
jgi:rare lipoprotein A